ncbi:MAG: hypothetical protein JWO82_1797 [Akkermansiaceae bacterium]|nr:hypothetical protein [Akkermansiaceae bacterium]
MENPRGRAGTVLGDYRLDLLLEDRTQTLTWLAEQVSIGRPVVLVELKQQALELREVFLADVRARASINLPVVGSVYEAVSTEDQCFVVMERLPGSTLADRTAAREGLQPVVMANVLGRLSEAMLQLEAEGIQTLPLELGAIYLDTHGILRLANIACAGPREPERSAADIATLGRQLQLLLADGLPGASRMNTLLAWMRGEGLEQPLSWAEVRDYTVQIEQQLTDSQPDPDAQMGPAKKKNRGGSSAFWGGLVLAATAVTLFFAMKNSREAPAETLPGPVSISAGTHPTPDGGEETLASFEISGHEVTIREYRDFLDELRRMSPKLKTTYDDPGQPVAKSDHLPADWEAMLAAAKNKTLWQGHLMSLECPVVNIDWWDAVAFCQQRGGRLPTQEEWFAALRTGLDNPLKLVPAVWSPVQEIPVTDRTPAGLYGMAGSVAEWTQDEVINPANPLGAKSHVIVGASYLRIGGGALAREWTTERTLRRPDLGFRMILPGE